MGQTRQPADAMRIALVVPTYNNARTLLGVLEQAGEHASAIVAVNDGSTDRTAAVLTDWQAGGADRFVVTHERNRGKAAALRSGFDFALARGFTHAITIDSDGQLDPADIPRMTAAATHSPRSLVVGVRRFDLEDYPGKNRLGRVLSNLAVRLECGIHLQDTQCGFRVYPLGLVQTVRCCFGRYAYETEVLTRCVWAGAGVVQCPVSCRYSIPGAERVSHFRPWRDTLQGLWLHARLLSLAVLPIPRPHVWQDVNGRPTETGDRPALWRRVLRWLNPLRAWREVRKGDAGPAELAAGLGVGVFIGVLPVYGLHTVMCLYTAARLHLNPHVTLAGSALYATPPQGLLVIALSIVTGQFLLRGRLLSPSELNLAGLSWFEIAGRFFLEWAVGSLLVGGVFAVLTGLLGYALFGLFRSRQTEAGQDAEAPAVAQVDSL
jgi:uncharacterized protein (DUF2062 family)